MGSDVMIYTLSFIKTGSMCSKLVCVCVCGGGGGQTTFDLINYFSFFKIGKLC
jgi:hypothetical protein